MRLFIALDIDSDIRERISAFVDSLRAHAPDVRFVGADSYHVTLKFIGETGKAADIERALTEIHAHPFDLRFAGTGFFPNQRSPRVFWAGIHADRKLQQLQSNVEAALSPLGFAPEKSCFHPHLTLARTGSGRPLAMRGDRPDPKLKRVVERLSLVPEPEFGTMTAREFFLYESRLSASGAQYFNVQRFPLDSAV